MSEDIVKKMTLPRDSTHNYYDGASGSDGVERDYCQLNAHRESFFMESGNSNGSLEILVNNHAFQVADSQSLVSTKMSSENKNSESPVSSNLSKGLQIGMQNDPNSKIRRSTQGSVSDSVRSSQQSIPTVSTALFNDLEVASINRRLSTSTQERIPSTTLRYSYTRESDEEIPKGRGSVNRTSYGSTIDDSLEEAINLLKEELHSKISNSLRKRQKRRPGYHHRTNKRHMPIQDGTTSEDIDDYDPQILGFTPAKLKLHDKVKQGLKANINSRDYPPTFSQQSPIKIPQSPSLIGKMLVPPLSMSQDIHHAKLITDTTFDSAYDAGDSSNGNDSTAHDDSFKSNGASIPLLRDLSGPSRWRKFSNSSSATPSSLRAGHLRRFPDTDIIYHMSSDPLSHDVKPSTLPTDVTTLEKEKMDLVRGLLGYQQEEDEKEAIINLERQKQDIELKYNEIDKSPLSNIEKPGLSDPNFMVPVHPKTAIGNAYNPSPLSDNQFVESHDLEYGNLDNSLPVQHIEDSSIQSLDSKHTKFYEIYSVWRILIVMGSCLIAPPLAFLIAFGGRERFIDDYHLMKMIMNRDHRLGLLKGFIWQIDVAWFRILCGVIGSVEVMAAITGIGVGFGVGINHETH